MRTTVSCDEDVGGVSGDELRSSSVNQAQRMVRVSMCCNAIFDEMWFQTTGPMKVPPVIFAEFSSERLAGVSWRSITVTNKSNSLTYTVASSVVDTLLLAVTTIVGRAEILTVSYSFELRSLLLTICMLLYCAHRKANRA